MLVRFCETDPGTLGGTFVEGGEREISNWFAPAGLGGTVVEYLERAVALLPIAEYVPEHLKALPWSAGFFELSSKEQALTIVWMEERLADYRTDDGIDVPFGSYLATAAI
jgi:hypothetical protein